MEAYTHSGDTRFTLAGDEQIGKANREARKWVSQPNQRAFTDSKYEAVSAVAEYILNQKGFTMYEMNATYPKVKS